MAKVKILKHIGDWVPGDLVDVSETIAKELCDGVKALRLDQYLAVEARRRDINNLTVKEMRELGMENKPMSPEAETFAKAEQAAMEGKPVAHGEPLVPAGGVTPPTQVFPAMIDAMDEHARPEVTKPEDVKVKKADKKVEEKKK